MPIYEYACSGCDHRFEHFQKMSDPLLTACPSCEAEGLRKLVSATSFHLKGGGWYKDHYGLKSVSDNSGGGSGDGPGSDSTGSDGPGSDSTGSDSPSSSDTSSSGSSDSGSAGVKSESGTSTSSGNDT